MFPFCIYEFTFLPDKNRYSSIVECDDDDDGNMLFGTDGRLAIYVGTLNGAID
jgi:hypothetical protein